MINYPFFSLKGHRILFLKYLVILFLGFYAMSCKKEKKSTHATKDSPSFKSLIKYAKGFDLQDFGTYKKLIIKSPFPNAKNRQEFILIDSKIKNKDQFNGQKLIDIPLKNIVVTSTTHIPMLELLDEESKIKGFPHTEYITSIKTRKLIEKGTIQDIGNEGELNTEVLISLNPEAVIGFSMGNNTKMYNIIEKNDIPVIYNGEWLEETPLGRAEWIKFFGVLFNKDKEADSIFTEIEAKYNYAKEIAKDSEKVPSILTGILFKDKWNLPAGESFTASLYRDANTNYLWKESKGQGSLVLSFESVYDKAKTADFWIGSGYFTAYKELAAANNHYMEFDAYKEKKIFTFSKRRGENGGVLYFELSPIQPHIVLQDLIKITHPELLPNYQPYFLEELNK